MNNQIYRNYDINPIYFRHRKIYPVTKKRKTSKLKKIVIKAMHVQRKNKRMNSKINFKNVLKSFFKHSSVYALRQVGCSKTAWRRIAWISIFIFGIIGCVTHVSQFLIAYGKYPVVTNIAYVRKTTQVFPAVTVCNLNSIRRDFMPYLEERLNNAYSESAEISGTDNAKSAKFNYTLCRVNAEYFNNNNTKEFIFPRILSSLDIKKRITYGHQKGDFIKSCKFNGRNCNDENYSSTVSVIYSNCYTFAEVRLENTLFTMLGSDSGLELELDLEVEKYTKFTDSVGARVQIHNPYLDHNIDTAGVNLRPGSKTFIGVSKRVSARRPHPYKDHCRQYDANDSQILCAERWLNNITIPECTCSISTIVHEIRECDYFDLKVMCCLNEAFKGVNSFTYDCPLSCYDVKYKYRISHTEWPSKAYYDSNQFVNTQNNGTFRNMSFEEVRKTRLLLKVFFDTLDETVFQQNPLYQSSEILTQIGGQMGVWLGLSLVAILEFLQNLITLCRHRIRYYKNC